MGLIKYKGGALRNEINFLKRKGLEGCLTASTTSEHSKGVPSYEARNQALTTH